MFKGDEDGTKNNLDLASKVTCHIFNLLSILNHRKTNLLLRPSN